MNVTREIPRTMKTSKLANKVLLYTLLAFQCLGRFELGNCNNLSEDTIKDMIAEDERRGIYRLESKNEIKRFEKVGFQELNIFCHRGKFTK